MSSDEPIAAMLSDADTRVLDLLVEAGMELDRLPPLSADDRARAERLVGLFGLIDAYPEESGATDSETLLAATMARIDQAEHERASRMRLEPTPDTGVRRRLRMGDLVAVASVAILATVVFVPFMNWRNAQAIQVKCANNLRQIAHGLESYTVANRSMPMTASLVPDLKNWFGYRNADNLNVLADQHYCTPGCMCCPGDTGEHACYAYQVPAEGRRPLWNVGQRTVIVGDRNPLVDLKRQGQTIGSVALNSASHGGRGQSILFTDGTIAFDRSPYIEDGGLRDNVWLPFGDVADALNAPPGSRPAIDAFLLH